LSVIITLLFEEFSIEQQQKNEKQQRTTTPSTAQKRKIQIQRIDNIALILN
jgi:hypothetical protein